MSSIDQRVVEMKFDQGAFKSGVASTLAALADLKKGLELKGATQGLEAVDGAAKRFSLRGMLDGLQGAMGGFSALGVVAATTIASITTKALAAGANIVKGLSLDPVMQGFKEYELKMGSIQTIMANTARHGTALETVNNELNSLNKYADKTIYNFAEMTKNASLFTASGMKIEDATTVIKGFSNAAAASGTSSQGAAGAAYQLSQALNTGTIRLMDWKSLQNVGMGNKNMQDSLIETAKAMGTFNAETTTSAEASKNFNGSLEKGWLTADVMSTYLKAMSGDMTDAEFAAAGYSAAQIKALKAQATTAFEAATKVRTLSQLMGTLKEAVASGWTESFEIIFGDFTEATKLFSAVSDTIGGMLARSAEARNKMLTEWDARGGRIDLIESIKNAWTALISVIKPIQDAFREIFPPATGRDLAIMTSNLREFTAGLKIGGETADNLKRTFKGVFALFSIGITIIKGIVSGIVALFSSVSAGEGSFLGFTANLGDALVKFDEMLKKSGLIKTFFTGLGEILALPVKLLKAFATVIGNLFNGFDSGAAEAFGGAFDSIGERFAPLGRALDRVKGWLSSIGNVFSKVGSTIVGALSGVGELIATAFSGDNFSKTLDAINTGLLAAIVLAVRKFFSGGLNFNFGGGGGAGFLEGVTGALDGLTGALKTMQTDIKANIILKIAAALALLTVSIVALSMIDSANLTKGLVALAAGFAILSGGMVILSKSISVLGSLKLPFIAAALVGLAAGLLLMALALKVMASMSLAEIAKALITLAASLTIISVAMTILSANSSGMIRAAIAMGLLGGALNLIALALKVFGTISWGEMARGLTAMAGALGVIAAAMHLMPKGMVAQAAALVLLSGAMNAMALAMKIFGSMNMAEIGKSLLVLAGSLVAIAGAMRLMPSGPNMLLQAAALAAVSVSLNIMAGALRLMGSMNITSIGKALIALGGSLLILAGGLKLMTGSLGGSAALLVAAGALAVLTPVLLALGSASIPTLVKALGALAAIFVIFGVAGLVLAPVTPVILALAAAIVLIGAGLALAGVGALAFAAAFAIVTGALIAAVAVVGGALSVFASAIGSALKTFGEAFVSLAKTIGGAAGPIAAAMTAMLGGLLQSLTNNAKNMAAAFTVMLGAFLTAITTNAGKITTAFGAIISALLRAIVENAPKIATAIGAILTSFLRIITENAPKIAKAISTILTNLVSVVVQNAPKLGAAFLAMITAGLNVLTQAIPKMADAGLKIIRGVIDAAAKNIAGIVKVAADLIVNFLNAIGKELPRVIDAGVKLVISFVNGVAAAIRNNQSAMNAAGRSLAWAIADGMTFGLAGKARELAGKAAEVAKGALDAAKNILGINSPSKEFFKVGEWSGEGMSDGLDSFAGIVANSAEAVGTGAFRAIRDSITGIPDLFSSEVDMTPVIRPIMDLSGVRASSGQLDSMFSTKQISVDAAYSSARDASAGYRSNKEALQEVEAYANGGTTTLSYTQINNSPKPINRAEVYRQTKNQLSTVRGELTDAHRSGS